MSLALFKKHHQQLQKLLPASELTPSIVRRHLPREKVLIVSPHPDDEILQSSLALRLQTENSMKVVNVAVTLGSKLDQRKRRTSELTRAVKYLKFKNYILSESWSEKKRELSEIIKKEKPSLIIAPHHLDQHTTHQRTSTLVSDVTGSFSGTIAWSEFWSAQKSPNLLVEVPFDVFLKQYKALEFHRGEIARNPYHLRLQSWLIDNVRRGSEIINHSGSESAPMLMGQLYRVSRTVNSDQCFALKSDDLSDWL